MSFFIKGKKLNGVKRAKYSNTNNKKRKIEKKAAKTEDITSSEDEDLDSKEVLDHTSSEDENETAQEKKLRLAKLYLQEIEKEEKLRLEDKEIDSEIISKRLKEDYLKEAGKLRLTIASKYKGVLDNDIQILKCRKQRGSVTCICISPNDEFVFTGSKDGHIVKYSLKQNARVGIIPFTKNNSNGIVGHTSKINAVAISSDNKFLVTADESSNIYIWDPITLKHIKTLSGHKKPITGLCFKIDSHTLYSGSKDRTIKVWSLDEMAYVETLFGHQDEVASVDTLYRDRLLSSGGRDLRIWKITEETQLIFNGHKGNIDNVKLINEENFISAGDDGQICIWSVMRKKPVAFLEKAHGCKADNQEPYWISSVTSLMNTDLVATGSQDGFIRLWKLDNNFKSIQLLHKIPIEGFVTALQFTSDGKKLIAACGKEHKLGRWSTMKHAVNGIYVIPFIIN